MDTAYDATEQWAGMEPVLPYTDLLMPNEVELVKLAAVSRGGAAFSGTEVSEGQLRAAMDFFVTARQVTMVVVTNGAKGAWACFKDSGGTIVVLHAPASDLAAVVDPTGAGDAFKAGFISEWKRLGGKFCHEDVQAALAVGCAAGAFAVSQLGACATQATRQRI